MGRISIVFPLLLAFIASTQSLSEHKFNEIDQSLNNYNLNEAGRNDLSELEKFRNDDPSERLFFTSNALGLGTTNTGTTSITIGNAGYLVLGAYILVPLIIGLALLFYLIGGQGGNTGTYGHEQSYGHSGSSYGSLARSFDPYAIDWEKFNIIDWISIGEEAWRKFNPSDLDCQKRLICEIHQNTSKFGAAAARMVDLFSYLQYAEVLSLPDEFKVLVEEYLDAADRGRSLQKDCGEIYDNCEFSVKKMVDKYSHNEI